MNPARRSPTLKDIAARVGISESAASLALAGKPGVYEKTRQAVLEVAEELGWTPNHAARVLSGSRSETIGLVFARDVEDVGSEAFFLQFLTGLQEILSAKDYGLLMQAVESVDEEIAVYRKWKRANRVDAVVLIDLRNDDPRPQAVHEMGLPAIIAGGSDPRGLLPEIITCDKEAMRLILDYLGDHHHERIAYICGDENLAHISKRIEEFRAGQAQTQRAVFPTDFSAIAGARAAEEALLGYLAGKPSVEDIPAPPTLVVRDSVGDAPV